MGSNTDAAVCGEQRDVDQRELALASIKKQPANRSIIPQNNAVMRVRVAHDVLLALRIKLHSDKSLSLTLVPVHERQLIRARGSEKVQ